MAKTLGPTFGDEVVDAGLGGLPIAWGATDDTIMGRDKLTPAQNATLDGVVAAHDPTQKYVIPTTDFVARFTNAEYVKLEQKRAADIAAAKVGNAKNWDVLITDPGGVNPHRQKTQTLKADLVADGILTQARANEIFS